MPGTMEYRWIYDPVSNRFIMWEGMPHHDEKAEEVLGEKAEDETGWNTWWGGNIQAADWSWKDGIMVCANWFWSVDYAPLAAVMGQHGLYDPKSMKEKMP